MKQDNTHAMLELDVEQEVMLPPRKMRKTRAAPTLLWPCPLANKMGRCSSKPTVSVAE